MDWTLPEHDRGILRELARKQAAYAALPVMQQRRKMWHDLNDGQLNSRPPVIIETWTFDRDFMPAAVFQCQTELGRRLEGQLLRHTRNHELIDDDKVIPNTFDVGWFTSIDEFGGVKIAREVAQDSQGQNLGYHNDYPIKDLAADFDKLKPAVCSVDKPKTHAYVAFLTELFGDLLPVRIRSGTFGHGMLTHRVVDLMGMEQFFMAMYECPDDVHKLMAYLRDNALHIMQWAEAEGLLRSNNANQDSFGSSYNFNTQLPTLAQDQPAHLKQMWGCANSQETVGVSPQMFHEFCFPYYQAVCQPVGLLYYGCCEPTHTFWEDIRRLPNLKKVSVNRWTDQRFMGQAVQGSGVILSRKPDPNFLGVDETLNEPAWRAHIRETLDATHGAPLEIIIRDVYTVHGDLGNARRAVAIARQEIDRKR